MQRLCASDDGLLSPPLPARLSLAGVSPSFRASVLGALGHSGGLTAALHLAEWAEWSGLLDEAAFAYHCRHNANAVTSQPGPHTTPAHTHCDSRVTAPAHFSADRSCRVCRPICSGFLGCECCAVRQCAVPSPLGVALSSLGRFRRAAGFRPHRSGPVLPAASGRARRRQCRRAVFINGASCGERSTGGGSASGSVCAATVQR